ncbi:hypothetical protein PVAG01_05830 [Phlyctema vagabunda]|uniref:Uncharacterized protein n=1 Tax=Phlyctema vagabunda TaxID=108571 RepID=A0ABR4PEB7_9HELO
MWTDGVRLFMGVAFAHDFVMQTLLAWSATHLSWATKNYDIMEEAYHYRAKAYRGLQYAIENFSAENSDAILVASIMMGWQATTTEGWMTMIRGTAVVKATITDHNYNSYFLEDDQNAPVIVPSRDRTHATLYKPRLSLQTMLICARQSLTMLKSFLGQRSKFSSPVEELIVIVQNILSLPPDQSSEIVEQEIKKLKGILFWTPTTFIDRINYDPTVMLFMAHLHAIALIALPLTNVASAYFRGLNAAPIQAFIEELSTKEGIVQRDQHERVMQLLLFPREAITYFKDTLQTLLADDCAQEFQDTNFSFQDTKISMLKVLTSCPVGLWHNSLETDCDDHAFW